MRKEIPASYDSQKTYSMEDAVKLLPELSISKFVGSVDLDVVLNATEKQKKESVRGSVTFPNQFGEQKKVYALVDEKDVKAALAAGAAKAGFEELIKEIEAGKVDFDVLIASPEMMPKVAKLGKVLGPKGLMPNPNNGTVSADVAGAIQSFTAGKFNFKMNEQGAIRFRVAKLDMTPEAIQGNIVAALKNIYQEAKKLNQSAFKKITLSPTMGKGVKLNVEQAQELAK